MIKIGIVGYGNLAKGVECAIRQNPDMELAAVFTRRDPAGVKILTPNAPRSSNRRDSILTSSALTGSWPTIRLTTFSNTM